ncbi:ankyrin repeat domain-containing protein [Endozoicomonas sp.]|uniref:ankyrin repeat domain-containing protein n=1 Tax=Endozoicomonas sp. TaxID=1892382 RepID=UPI00288654E9|nr:ankyrin repeat domain-containing protein [Endozoicomonas sp.]
MGTSTLTNQSVPLSQGEHHSLIGLVSIKNKKCRYKNHEISSDEKVANWITNHYSARSGIVGFDRNIPCRSARRHPPAGFHPGYFKKTSFTPDSQSTSPSLSTKDDSNIIEINILVSDAETNEQVLLQKDSAGQYYLSDITGKRRSLSDLGTEQRTIKRIVESCLAHNLNKPIEFMIQNEVINPKDSNFEEPIIHLAISYIQKELLKFLLNGKYVDINVRNSEGDTPLIVAIMLHPAEGILEIIDLLLKYKPDLTIKDRLDQTALKNAACFIKSYEITKRLLEHRASPNEITELPAIQNSMTEQEKVEIQKIHNLFTEYRAIESSTLSAIDSMV